MYIGMCMKFLVLETHNPHLNLAIEEYLFRNSKDDIFMLWQNEPTVVIGKNQNAHAEVNLSYLAKHNVFLARRLTGGGAVYHDLGNVNYTFISSEAKQGIDFEYFTLPIIGALKELGVDVSLSGRNDLETSCGAKISGNAQYSNNGRVLHHGTLLFSSDLYALSSALKVDEEKIKSKAIKSTRARVTNIKDLLNRKITVDEFINNLSDYIIKVYSPDLISPPSIDDVSELYKKYASDEWMYPQSKYLSGYALSKKKRYPFGTVEVQLSMLGEIIESIRIFGDFFGVLPIEELESKLRGINMTSVFKRLSKIDINGYILGMTAEDLASLIVK